MQCYCKSYSRTLFDTELYFRLFAALENLVMDLGRLGFVVTAIPGLSFITILVSSILSFNITQQSFVMTL
jgi:hypothetical protein